MTEISESDNSKQVDSWNPSSNTSTQQPHFSQVSTIGCADEGLWIFSLEDSKKRRYTVNWEDQSRPNQTEKWKTEEHELMIDSGCFGHVCPPWFAPQFPMVSLFYKRRRCGSEQRGNATLRTKSGVRARDDEQWKTNFDPDTFDVMNVRKPLLSTSALKHRGVTIIFNHDCDRIIFRNETVNLVSHDCHSYLHVILTNGIPPCKTLVMAGESATNDVDEEVYDNDENERNEAREAGDRRALADADQAGQLDISGEAKTARSRRTLEPPTDAARMAHNATHVLIPDHEVRAAKLTNRWISGSWWGRDASSDEHLVGTKHGLLKCRSVRRKPPGEQWSRRETIEARGTEWNFDVEMDSGIPGPTLEPRRDEGMPTATAPMEIPTVPLLAPPPEEYTPEFRVPSNSGGGQDEDGDLWLILRRSYENEGD